MLPASTHISSYHLLVRRLSAASLFYQQLLGLQVVHEDSNEVVLGYQKTPLVRLTENKDLPFADSRQSGLYHAAFLFQSPGGLARALQRLAEQWPTLYQGSADHIVSQAFYLADPEGNGIELYIDRPRDQWTYKNGQIVMGSLPLDPGAFVTQNLSAADSNAVAIGHIHLRVGAIEKARLFYVNGLGFEVMADMGSALFVAAGGYHHHLGMNTWESDGTGQRTPQLGLASFGLEVPLEDDLVALSEQLERTEIAYDLQGLTLSLLDPWGNKVEVSVSEKVPVRPQIS